MQRGLVVPHFRVPDIRSINWAALKARGCRGVVFDKDNTLTAPYAPSVFPSLAVPLPRTPVLCLVLATAAAHHTN
jgi:predicted HAD superfamily phosphohydrolase YqeG